MQIKAIRHITGQPHFHTLVDHNQHSGIDIFMPFCIPTKDEYCITLRHDEYERLKEAMADFERRQQEVETEEDYYEDDYDGPDI